MAPSWISSAHERWLGGEELDFALDMDGYRLQPFLGLKIALSGIEPRAYYLILWLHPLPTDLPSQSTEEELWFS
jgi:hypothetical protein